MLSSTFRPSANLLCTALGTTFALALAASGCGTDADTTGAGARGDEELRRAWQPAPGSDGTLRIVGGDMVLSAPGMSERAPGQALGINGHHTLFLNFEGAAVRNGGSDAMEHLGIRDTKQKGFGVIELAPYAPDQPERYKAILDVQKLVAGWYQPVNIDIVISRPLRGDYMMTIVGGDPGDLGLPAAVAGISQGDCRNQNELDLDYAFSGSPAINFAVKATAVTAAHESGHALGLGHTQEPRDVMFPSVSDKVEGFVGGQVADPGPCNAMMGDFQDSLQVLIDNLGARDPRQPRRGHNQPAVKFIAPQMGAATPSDLTIAVQANAELGLSHVTLSITKLDGSKGPGGHPVAELRPPVSSARVRFSEGGDYLLIATAYDLAGNPNVATNKIKVATPACGSPNDCTPGQKCMGGTCVTPPPPPPKDMPMMSDMGTRPYGTACQHSSECMADGSGPGGLCAITPVGELCTHYCSPGRLCAGSLACVDGICLPPLVMTSSPKPGQLGGKCTRNQDCFIGTDCSLADPKDPAAPRYCTKVCDPDVAYSCPVNMVCQMTDGPGNPQNRCVIARPMPAGSGGGCTASPAARGAGSAASGAGLGLLLLVQLFVRRYGRAS